MTRRCFIAIELSKEIQKKIAQIQDELPKEGIKFVESKNVHVTLKFLGEVADDRVDAIKEMLSTIQFTPFSIHVYGGGVFPNERYIQVVWAGAKGKELEILAQKINETLVDFKKEEFKGHITIARVKRKLELHSFLEKYKQHDFGIFECKEFVLKESKLTAEGPVYSTIASFKGGGSGGRNC